MTQHSNAKGIGPKGKLSGSHRSGNGFKDVGRDEQGLLFTRIVYWVNSDN